MIQLHETRSPTKQSQMEQVTMNWHTSSLTISTRHTGTHTWLGTGRHSQAVFTKAAKPRKPSNSTFQPLSAASRLGHQKQPLLQHQETGSHSPLKQMLFWLQMESRAMPDGICSRLSISTRTLSTRIKQPTVS